MSSNPPRLRPPATRALKGLAFETWVFWMALAVALPGLVAVGVLLWMRDASPGVWWGAGVPLVLVTLLLATRLRNQVVFPLYTLSNLLEALREGDFSLRGTRARRGDAVGEVIWEVNALGQTLREQRLRVEETLALLTKVLANVDIAIFTFDGSQKLRLINPAGARLLAIAPERAQGKTAAELGLTDCLELVGNATVKRTFPGGSGSWEIRRAGFREGGLPLDLIAITDLSRALREEERQAWQRLIRVLGHELNNSLAPIRSMAATLRSVMGRETLAEDWREDLQGGLAVIGDRAEALTRFMLGYTTLARLPPPVKRPLELGALLARVARLEQRASVQVLEPAAPIELVADPDQLEQALINLTKNAVEAALPAGGGVRVRSRTDDGHAVIEVEDEGPGLATTDNLFVPFFTTKPGGSGIGLVLARQIVEAHDGSLALENRRDAVGCVARIRLPL